MNMPVHPSQWWVTEEGFDLSITEQRAYDRLLHTATLHAPDSVAACAGQHNPRTIAVSGLMHALVGLAFFIWAKPMVIVPPVPPAAVAWISATPAPQQPQVKPSRPSKPTPATKSTSAAHPIARPTPSAVAELNSQAMPAASASGPAADAAVAHAGPVEPAAAIVPVDVAAAYLNNPPPAYPPLSRRAGEQGEVKLRVHVREDGRATTVDISQSSGFARLDAAAREAVLNWRFTPAHRGDERLSAWVIVPVKFKLTGF